MTVRGRIRYTHIWIACLSMLSWRTIDEHLVFSISKADSLPRAFGAINGTIIGAYINDLGSDFTFYVDCIYVLNVIFARERRSTDLDMRSSDVVGKLVSRLRSQKWTVSVDTKFFNRTKFRRLNASSSIVMIQRTSYVVKRCKKLYVVRKQQTAAGVPRGTFRGILWHTFAGWVE